MIIIFFVQAGSSLLQGLLALLVLGLFFSSASLEIVALAPIYISIGTIVISIGMMVYRIARGQFELSVGRLIGGAIAGVPIGLLFEFIIWIALFFVFGFGSSTRLKEVNNVIEPNMIYPAIAAGISTILAFTKKR